MRDTTAQLTEWLRNGGQRIGQILIRPHGDGWELRHHADAESDTLETFTRWEDARLLANLDEQGAYRPLKTAPNLRRGWWLQLSSAADVRRALDYFYPAMLGIWISHKESTLLPVDFRATLGRQTGMYRVTQKVSDAQAQVLVGKTCRTDGGCLKTILWTLAPGQPLCMLPPEKFKPATSADEIPLLCHEACNLLVAGARKVVKGEAPE